MKINEIRESVEKNNCISFKLFALIYIIEKVDNQHYLIYTTSMPNSKRYFRSLDELLTKYRIFGDNIISYEDRLRKIEK